MRKEIEKREYTHAEGWEVALELTERKRMAGHMKICIEIDGVVLCDKKMHSCRWYSIFHIPQRG
jgi:hypothetical protein